MKFCHSFLFCTDFEKNSSKLKKLIYMNATNLLKRGALVVLISIVSAILTVLVYAKSTNVTFKGQENNPSVFKYVGNSSSPTYDFTLAAELSVNAVVHVKTKTIQKQQSLLFSQDPFFDYFFGQPRMQQPLQPLMGSGSGVIISNDGYIVTNNHVIANADEIEVVLNDKRTFTATLVGKDPNTDIALLKIDADDLSLIKFGNSDDLKVGEWVLAVGNPFNLTSTVTAGIVSAKARNINIINAEMKIESFIQTDAAVNPGNSGGALVNTRGELVGINTAIASQTGSYAGYSFAIPVSIVSKIVADLKEFGEVQRAILGVSISDLTDQLTKEKNIKTLEGAYVKEVSDNSAAKEAGIKEGDIIIGVNETKIKSVSELTEQIARYSPGDKITVTILRDNNQKKVAIELKNKKGSIDKIKSVGVQDLGASFEEISDKQIGKLIIKSAVQVVALTKNGKFEKAGMQKDFIILKINNKFIKEVADIDLVVKAVENSMDKDNVLFISGIYPNGKSAYYAINLQE